MNAYEDIVLFGVGLAINLLLLGAIIVAGLSLSFRFIKDISPRLRYLISVALFLLAIVLPFVLIFENSLGQRAIWFAFSEIAPQRDIRNGLKPAIDQLSQSMAVPELNEDSTPGLISEFSLFIATSPLGTIFLSLWILGTGYLLFREMIAFQQLRHMRQKWQRASDEEQQRLLCPKEIPLYFDEQQSPGTVGLLSPIIVLPKNFPDHLSLEAKRLIVQHELAHVFWRDPLITSLLRLIKAIFWISPALWLLERLIGRECEVAADHAAITALSNEVANEVANELANELEVKTKKLIYADTLAAVAKQFNSLKQQNRRPQMIGMGSGKSELENRIQRLFSSAQTTYLNIACAMGISVLTLLMISVIPLAAVAKKAINQQKESSITTNSIANNLAALTTTLQDERSTEQQQREHTIKKLNTTALTDRPDKTGAALGRLKEKFLPLSRLKTDLKSNNGLGPLEPSKALPIMGPIRQN